MYSVESATDEWPKLSFFEKKTLINLSLKLHNDLQELTSKEWSVVGELNKWDLRFKCTIGDFRYYTEWYDWQKLNESIIRKDAEIISMWYQRRWAFQ